MESNVAGVIKQYRTLGLVYGSDLLLEPAVALGFAEALIEQGIQVFGCDLWKFLDDARQVVVGILGGPQIYLPPHELTPAKNLELVEEFLTDIRSDQKYSDVELISFLFQDGEIDELVERLA